MTPRDFIYWLQGHLEISGTNALSKKQVAEIRKHIKLVMTNQTNKFHEPPEDFHQGILGVLERHRGKNAPRNKPTRPRACASPVMYC